MSKINLLGSHLLFFFFAFYNYNHTLFNKKNQMIQIIS